MSQSIIRTPVLARDAGVRRFIGAECGISWQSWDEDGYIRICLMSNNNFKAKHRGIACRAQHRKDTHMTKSVKETLKELFKHTTVAAYENGAFISSQYHGFKEGKSEDF